MAPKLPRVAPSRVKARDLVLHSEDRASSWRRSSWPCWEANGGARPWAMSRSIPRTPLRLHLSLVLPAPPPLCFQRYFQHGKFYLKGIFPLSLFFFLLDEKPRGCKMQSFPPS